jgi:hypothetical protein
MKEKKLFLKILSDLFFSWSSDAPKQAVWIANDLIKFAENEFNLVIGLEFEEDESNFDEVIKALEKDIPCK